jgi:hypothetical protein
MSMSAKGNGTGGKGGAALVTAIVFVFFLTLFGLAFYRLGETDIDLFAHEKNLSKALYASEAGLDKVRWMLREIPGVNPFSKDYDDAAEDNAISIANPTGGDFFPGETDKPYFKVSMIQDVSILEPTENKNRVRVRVLGSVDADDDGLGGLTDSDTDGFTFDPDDVNRKFEAFISLPGSLSENVSAVARAFSGESGPFADGRLFVTPDGDSMNGFLYFGSPPSTWGIWDRWEFIFSNPVITGDVELPPGIFDETGEFIDDDNDGIPDYFQDLDPRVYAGGETFTPLNDPTAGVDGKAIIYVNGNITIDSVDFGYLNDNNPWDVRNSDWEGYPPGELDLTFIANGNITVTGVDCGNVGRLVLVAKNIIFKGDYNTKVNGIAIASDDITLDGDLLDGSSSCQYGLLTPQSDSRPVKYAAYFLGSMVAGDLIRLEDDGWAVIYDENVINGNMYSSAADSILKPTLTYERVEAEDFNTTNNWDLNGGEFLRTQEDYIQEDIDNARADYSDEGADGVPELMKMYQVPNWKDPAGPEPDDHDFGVTDGVYCDFADVGNVFEDSDINIDPQDWDNYTTIRFYMALDNWQKIAGSKTTYRKSLLQVRLEDTAGNRVTYNVPYQNNDWIGAPGKAHWEPVRINPHDFDPLDPFDSRSVQSIEFYWKKIEVSWYIDGQPESITFINDHATGYGEDGYYNYRKFNGTGYDTYPVQFEQDAVNLRYKLYYEDPPGNINYIQWNWDPSTSTLEDMYFEDTLDPLKSALVSVFKIDRIELPGKPAANHLKYGLPHCLRLEITNWHEF